ncbi:MAG: hypothetical protein Q4G26_07220 [Paracoccus sp. (in: a-proteobacteria)]|nr:hypothetical protein [Paracoccus sp. (in: a-proteobacteria)]
MSDTDDTLITPAGWQHILQPDEVILWQGRPDFGLQARLARLTNTQSPHLGLIGTVCLVSAGFLMLFNWFLFGVVFLFAGALAMERRQHARLPSLREPAWYTLTNRRAIIATQPPKKPRQLASYPLDASMMVELWPDKPPSILFGPELGRAGTRPGFRYIPDAEQVMQMIRDIQARAAPEADP